MVMTIWRQGDVVLRPVDFIPAGLRKQKGGLLRKGEHGGLHSLFGEGTEVLVEDRVGQAGRPKGTKFVNAPNGGTVKHGEHGPVEIPAGKYAVVVQREVERGRTRQVVD